MKTMKRCIVKVARQLGCAYICACMLITLRAGQLVPADTNWFNQAFAHIRQSEYFLSWQPDVGAWRSPNRAQNLRLTYRDDGFSVEPRDHGSKPVPWQVTLRLAGWGEVGGSVQPVGPTQWSVQDNRAEVKGQGITIRYVNDPKGVEQIFELAARPAGRSPLRLLLSVDATGVTPAFSPDASYVSLQQDDGTDVLRYDGLAVKDAAGTALAAWFEQELTGEIAIVVDDRTATYPIVVDPTLTAVKSESDSQSGETFGFSVAYTKNIQSSSESGIVVGAPYWDNGGTADVGKVFVYYTTTSTLPSTPTWTAAGDQAYSHLGWSVACDFIKDSGHYDIIAGAPDYSTGNGSRPVGATGPLVPSYTQDGAVFLWHGTANGLPANATPANADWSRAGQTNYAKFGFSLATGHFQYSGPHGLAVGAPYMNDSGGHNPGAVLVFQGTSTAWPSATPVFSAYGSISSEFGYSLAAFDLDHDNYADLIVGAPTAYNGITSYNYGNITIYWGSQQNGLTTTSAVTQWGDQAGEEFGFSVAAGHSSSDSYSGYLIVGAPVYNGTYTGEGKAYIYYDNSSQSAISLLSSCVPVGDQTGCHLGWSVAAGDLNNDGHTDFIVGLPYHDYSSLGLTADGAVWLYVYSSGYSSTPTLQAHNDTASYEHFGYSLSYGEAPPGTIGFVTGTPDASGGGYVIVWQYSN